MSSVVKKEVNVFLEHLVCDCGEVFTGSYSAVSRGWSTEYNFVCSGCGKQETTDTAYPKLVYKDKE